MYEDLGAIAPGGTVSSARSTMALDRIQKIIKQYQGRSDGSPGLKVHTRQRITLLLAKGQQTYLVGPAATDSRSSILMGRTTVATAYASGTSLVVTSNTDTTSYPGTTITMANSDIIGVQANDGTVAYTTISSIAGVPTLTLAGAVSAAAVGKYVWWFTARAQRFPAWEAAVLRDENFKDVPLEVYSEVAQYELGVSDKFADGSPTAILIEPGRLNTKITLNSQPTDVTQQIVITAFYPAEDIDAAGNDIAFPQEGLRFVHWELAFALSHNVGRWTAEMEKSRNEARTLYFSLNPENSTLYFDSGGP